MKPEQAELGVWAAEEIEAKRVGKEASLRPLLRTVAVATAGKMGAKWDFSPAVAADALLPPRLLARLRKGNPTQKVRAECTRSNADIAIATGFSSQSHFTAAFRRHKGKNAVTDAFVLGRWSSAILTSRHTLLGTPVHHSQCLPVPGLLEGMGRAIERTLVEMAAYQHQANRQAFDHSARQGDRWVVGSVKRTGVTEHLARPLPGKCQPRP